MVFEFIDGEPVARLDHKADGTPRVPDGAVYFTFQQALARYPGVRDLLPDSAPAEAPPPASDEQRRLMRSLYPELADDALLEEFLALCRERNLSGLVGQVRPKVVVEAGGARHVELMMGIEG